MKRRRSNKARSDRSVSPAGCTMRRRIESPRVSEDDAEEEPQPRRSNDSSTLLPLQSQREPRGFAYLRDANKKKTTTSSLVVPQASSSEEESGDVAASPISTRSITRGFSHLRESISFALPRLYGSVPGVSMTRGGSVVVPLSTPPPRDSEVRHSNSSSRSQRANRGTPFLLQNNNNNNNNNNKTNNRYQNQNQQEHRRNLDYHDNRKSSGSDHSFLSSHSAIEYLNSTGSLGEVFSSRGSRRSSRATASHHSMSRSTLGPLDLSPILRKERQPRRRRRQNDTGGIEAAGGSNCNGGNNNDSSSVRQPPLNGLPIDVPATVVNPPPTGVRNSQKMTLEEFHRSLARLSRVVSFLLFSFFLITVWGVLAAPLVMRQSSPEEVFVRHYVDSISELQFIYEVPYASLSSSDARRLYLRVLSETLERLERSTSHVKPGANIEAQILHHKQMIRAYLTVRHRARLYARSRERSRLNQFVISPLHAAWQYGFERHGFMTTLRELVLEPSFSHVWARVKDIASCLRQDEKMLCPTLEYIQEEQQQQQQQHEGEEHEYGVPLDNNELNHPSLAHNGEKAVEELRQLKRMLNYVKESCRKRNRDYNHLLSGDDTESVLS